MLTTIALILAIVWLISLIAGVGGGLIHLLLIAAAALLIYDVLMGRRHAHLR